MCLVSRSIERATKVASQPITVALQSAQIYFWLLKSTTDTTASSSLSTAFEQAIIYRSKTTDTEWSFPSDITPAPSIDTSDFRGAGGALSSGSVVLAGSYVSSSAVGTASNGQASSAIKLLSVPEPATASLGLFGLAALCGFRRRRA